MSTKQAEAFYQELAEDKDLKDQIASLRGDLDTVQEEIAKIAREKGFDVVIDDIRALYSSEKELDDAELDSVAGGCSSVCGEICGLFLGHWMGRQ